MKFSGKMWLMIILKVKKNPGFHRFSGRCIFFKNHSEDKGEDGCGGLVGLLKLTPQLFKG